MEGYALSALSGALVAGASAWLVWGRKVMTRENHKEICEMVQVPIQQHFEFVEQSQQRTEVAVAEVRDRVDKVLGVLHKMNGGEP